MPPIRPFRLSPARAGGAAPATRACRAALWVAALVLSAAPATAAAPTVEDMKAAMLFNIAKFVDWPSGSFSSDRGQVTFAVLGEDALAGAVAATLSTKSINGRPVFVRCVRRVEDATDCQILFISASEEKRVPEVLQSMRGRAVLTVADVNGFAAMGGMVDFIQDNDRIRFEINLGSAERAQLKISSKVLAIARIVAEAQ
jgi:hypothetical protein